LLNLKSISDHLQGLSKGEDDVVARTDEAEALLTQARDVRIFSEHDEAMAAQIERQMAQLRCTDSMTIEPPGPLATLNKEYVKHHRRITKTNSRKSLEQFLRTEPDATLRMTALDTFRSDINDPETMEVILKILKLRGPQYLGQKVPQLSFRGDVDALIAKSARQVAPQISTVRASDADIYFEMQKNSALRATAHLSEYRNAVFQLVESLFALRIKKVPLPSYDPANEVYELHSEDGILGIWHFDFFRRPGKYRGAWSQTVKSRRLLPDGSLQIPVVFLAFDLEKALINFRESRSFLHEIGHALEHCLNTQAEYKRSGINGLSPDTREISSLYMETFAADPRLVQLFGDVGDKAVADAKLEQAFDLAQLCLLSKVDLDLHRLEIRSAEDLKGIVAEARRELDLPHPLIVPEYVTVFDHAFADEEYAGVYYSYLLGNKFASTLRQASPPDFAAFWRKEGNYAYPRILD
jgi:hypothetical protein